MSARGKVPLPKAVFALIEAVEGTDAPDSVCMILAAAGRACLEEFGPQKPVVVLNRSFGQLKRQHPGIYSELAAWLVLPSTVQFARSAGAYWAWVEWCKATDRLLRGATAGTAFGANRSGRPRHNGFTRYEDAALLAGHLQQNDCYQSMAAEAAALEACGRNDLELDQRSVQRHRDVHRSYGITSGELFDQAKVIRMKYRETKG